LCSWPAGADPVASEPGDGELLIRAHAASVNPVDAKYRRGIVQTFFPKVLGIDVAGVVESVGGNVTGLAPGDEVVLNPAVSPVADIVALGNDYQKKGIGVIAVNANDPGKVAEDGYDTMQTRAKEKNFGYNAATDSYEDLVKSGVIDPTKVTRTALQNAASIAGLLLTTECVVVEKKEDKPAPSGPPGGGMGGMY